MKKEDLIKQIQDKIADYAYITIDDILGGQAPIYKSMGKDNNMLMESFDRNGATVTEYVHESAIKSFDVIYEDLSIELLTEINTLLEGLIDFSDEEEAHEHYVKEHLKDQEELRKDSEE